LFDAEYGCTPVDDAFDDDIGLEAEFVEEHELEEEEDEDDEDDDGDGVVDDDVELDRIF
jgi:hypothetical protein